jgi:hypothetical protein
MSVKRYVKLLNAAVQALFYSVRLTHYSCPDKPGLMNQHKQTSVRAFRRTEAGRAALEDKNSGLSVEYRRILEQIGEPDGLRPLLSSYSKAQIVEWLGQLITLRMIESGVETGNQDHLRFTGRFKVSELAAAFNERS